MLQTLWIEHGREQPASVHMGHTKKCYAKCEETHYNIRTTNLHLVEGGQRWLPAKAASLALPWVSPRATRACFAPLHPSQPKEKGPSRGLPMARTRLPVLPCMPRGRSEVRTVAGVVQ